MRTHGLQAASNLRLGAYVIAFACVAQAACTHRIDGDDAQEIVGRTIQPIVNGSPSTAAHDDVVVLARFVDGGRASLCSATLVAPNLLLTARHCVSIADSSAMCAPDGTPAVGAMLHGDREASDFAVFVGSSGVAPSSTDESKASARGKTLVVDDASTICNHDVAFVVLDRALTAPIAPIRLGPPAKGETFTAVGWGIDETGHLPASRMERANLSATGFGAMAFPDDARYGIGNAEFLVGESACSGDSGSSVLAASGAVIGVASRVGNGKPRDASNWASVCLGDTVHAVYTHLGSFHELVDRAFAAAGTEPWIEGAPDPRLAVDAGPADGGASTPSAIPPTTQTTAAPVPEEPASDAAGGCAVADGRGAPKDDPVPFAIGATALLATIGRLLRRKRPV